MTHINSATDPISISLAIAAERDLNPCLHCLATSTEQAGVLDAPRRDSGDLDAHDVAAVQALLREHRLGISMTYDGGWTKAQAATRLRIVARIASLVLPPTVYDYEGWFAVELDDAGYWPSIIGATNTLELHVMRVEKYLGEVQGGEWVDPNALAGEVANVHDAARAVEVLLDLAGGPR